MTVPILQPQSRWECPNCTLQQVTTEQTPHVRMHACAGLKGLTAPMVPAGTRCNVTPVERGDWVGQEIVQTDGDGKPWMAVMTERDDGIDCAVLAPLARGGVRAEMS